MAAKTIDPLKSAAGEAVSKAVSQSIKSLYERAPHMTDDTEKLIEKLTASTNRWDGNTIIPRDDWDVPYDLDCATVRQAADALAAAQAEIASMKGCHEQVRFSRARARNAALEEAARVAEQFRRKIPLNDTPDPQIDWQSNEQLISSAIRALKDKPYDT